MKLTPECLLKVSPHSVIVGGVSTGGRNGKELDSSRKARTAWDLKGKRGCVQRKGRKNTHSVGLHSSSR